MIRADGEASMRCGLRGAAQSLPIAGAVWFVAWLWLSPALAAQPTTRAIAGGDIENQPIRRVSSVPASQQASVDSAASDRSRNILDAPRVLLALLVVVGLIFALRWFGKRLIPGAIGAKAAGAIRVLARSPVSPRQQVLLIQVGRRILVVGDNGTQMSPLCDIADPDEVASLVGQINNGASSGARDIFSAAFGAARNDFDRKMEPGADEDVADSSVPEAPAEVADQAIVSTRGEIAGLMEKVRLLARQLGKS